MRDLIVWVVGVCLLAVVSPPANAELVTINIEGVVDTVDDSGNYLEGLVNPGDIITGWYTYDTDTPDTSPEEWLGYYEYSVAPYGMVLDIGSVRFQTDFSNVDFTVGISNNRPSPTGDIYSIISNNNLQLPNNVGIGSMFWQLNDYSGQALQNTNLTGTAPILEAWDDGNLLRIEGIPRETEFIVSAHITDAVPEPATFLLFAVGTAVILKKKS